MKFITDEEINLNKVDSLQTKKYVTTLKEMIRSSDSKYTIGLFGEWGTGKSSIVKTVQEELEKETPKDIKFIVYDAWKYSGDSFRRMFIKTLSDKLKFNLSEEIDNFYYDKTEEIETKKFDMENLLKNIGSFIGLSLLIYLFIYILWGDEITKTDNIGLIAIIPIIISSISIFLNNAYKSQKKVVQYNKFFAPEQFENLTNELLSKSLKNYPKLELVKEFFKGNHHSKNLKKIVIVIDNIDRCDSETSYQLLTNIKNFLANKEGVTFLIPIDDESLKRHLSIEGKNNSKEADEFLRKFFNVSLKIKYFQPTDLFQYTKDLNDKYGLGLNPSTIDIISKEYATNPRRVIQMLNNLTTELNLIKNKISEEFILENQTLISVLLIIREEWVNLYKRIVKEPHIIKDKTFVDKDENEITLEQKKFLKTSKTVIEKSELLSIEKIVLNIDNNSLLPQEVISFIENEDFDSINKSIEEEVTSYEKIYNYLIEELNKEVRRQTFDTSVNFVFLMILKLNNIEPLNYDLLSRIKNIIDDENILNKIITNIEKEDFDNLFNFVINNKDVELSYLYFYFKKQYSGIWNKEYKEEDFENLLKNKSEIIKEGFISYLKIIPLKLIDKSIKKIFQNYYRYNRDKKSLLIENENISLKTLQKLDFEDISNHLIKKINFTFTNVDNKTGIKDYINEDYNELKFIMNNGLVSLKEVESLFEKFKLEFTSIPFFGQPENIKKSLTEIVDNFIIDLTELIYKLKSEKHDSPSIKSFIQELNSNKPFYYNNNNRYSDSFIYVNELIKDENYKKNYLDFLIQVYSTTLNNTSVVQNIYTIIQKYPDLKIHFYLELLKLNKEKNSTFVTIFKDKIYEYKEYSNENYLEVLRILFEDKKRDSEKISLIIKEILDEILIKDENEIKSNFVESLLNDEGLKKILTSEIIKYELVDIKKFNQGLQRLTYNNLCSEDKIFEIDENILIDMIEVNEKFYKKDILRVIKSNLPKVSKLPIVFTLIDSLATLTDEEKKEIIKELSQHSENEEYKSQVKEYCKKLEI
ncbi:P-loop NTPase fold protein [Arcobacter aquimarinus]|uniref:P-loop NTPase fold protein n=1 Tax=Arcobacter aquimarinus TaxID=1315211 RepID=UPI003BB0A1C0